MGRAPYFWTLLTNPSERGGRLQRRIDLHSAGHFVGLCMDMIYQVIVLKTFYPGEAVIVALVLAFIPYLLLRGPIARIARRWRAKAPQEQIR